MEEGADEVQFLLTIWEGPECYDASKKEKKEYLYPFSDEGMDEIIEILNALK